MQAVTSITDNLRRAWTMFGSKPPTDEQIIMKAFKTPNGEQDQLNLAKVREKIQCDCDKDPQFKFTCKKGIMWFVNNREMIQKIKKKVSSKQPGE